MRSSPEPLFTPARLAALDERIEKDRAVLPMDADEVWFWRTLAQRMGAQIFFAERALRAIALNHAEPARRGVIDALNSIDGIGIVDADLPDLRRSQKELTEALKKMLESAEDDWVNRKCGHFYPSVCPCAKNVARAALRNAGVEI